MKRNDLDKNLYNLSRVYKKMGGRKYPAEIVIVGGAAILLSYDFRYTTSDIDALGDLNSTLKDAIIKTRDLYHLSDDWLNSDFKYTVSFTRNIIRYSKFYKTYNQVLNVRVVNREYLIAMKLCSFRKYKFDISDIVGVLINHNKKHDRITFKDIDIAVKNLYSGWDNISLEAQSFIKTILKEQKLEKYYKNIREVEEKNKTLVLDFVKKNPDKVSKKTADEIIAMIKKKL